MLRTVITGANGHIGAHVVRAAREAGMTPIAFVRKGSDRRALAGTGAEIREGNIQDKESLILGLAGADIVFHVAAPHRNFAKDPNDLMRPAVDGTKRVIEAARAVGVRRLVYTSTAATMGFTDDPKKALTEDAFLERANSPYIQAKIEAEWVAREEAKRGGLEIIIVNPSGVFGPGDHRITPATRAIVGLVSGDPAFFHVCVTDVRDVARGHVLAAQKGQPGRRYLLTGAPMSPGELRDIFARVSGVKPPTFRPPRFLLNYMAGRMERQALASGQDASLTRAMILDAFGKHLVYDSSRARSELGASFRPAEEVLRDTVRWLLFRDALVPKVADKVKRALGERAAPDPDWGGATPARA